MVTSSLRRPGDGGRLIDAVDRRRTARSVDGAAVRAWLVAVAMLVFVMIVVGGATRLTDSGLSITEWQPILGALPPMTAADWQVAFDKYRTTLQYHSVNKGMSLESFQFIFWWEWAHRLLGRLIGAALAVPLIVFWLAGRLSNGMALKVLGVGMLVGFQGFLGWYMVQSGLSERIDVSQYRLALHLSMAFVILGCLAWLILDLGRGEASRGDAGAPAGAKVTAVVLAALVFSQVAIGGFVAGLKAGRAYNTWPTMDGQWIPDGMWRISPWWLNLSENITTVQFNHRLAAYVLVAVALWHAARSFKGLGQGLSRGALVLACAVLVQMGIGIATVVAAVPIGLGILHQGFAAVVFVLALAHAHAALLASRRNASKA